MSALAAADDVTSSLQAVRISEEKTTPNNSFALLAGIVAFLLSDVFCVEQPDKPPPASIAADKPRRWPIYASMSALKNFEIFGRRPVRRTPFRNASVRETLHFAPLSTPFAFTREY
ncbi:hypothetical protein ACPUER_13735 [Burkholderia sp. DN3021]|uniref:hypothetical protein n=1 Tax=Burkholderia sp. DN3021 TaxID=3410137 RepID=UPI003C7E384D